MSKAPRTVPHAPAIGVRRTKVGGASVEPQKERLFDHRRGRKINPPSRPRSDLGAPGFMGEAARRRLTGDPGAAIEVGVVHSAVTASRYPTCRGDKRTVRRVEVDLVFERIIRNIPEQLVSHAGTA